MHKLVPVEDAKTLFNEAKDWSVWRWLTEKKHARTTADAAWEALEACEEKVKAAGQRIPDIGGFCPTADSHKSRNSARKPSCSKCRSLVRTSVNPSLRIVCIEMQSVRL